MSVMDAHTQQVLLKRIDAEWMRANDEDLWPRTRMAALDIVKQIFDDLDEHCQPELMNRYGISRAAIDELAAELHEGIKYWDRVLMFVGLAFSGAAYVLYVTYIG